MRAKKAVNPREQALLDIEDALAYYLAEHAESAALGFVDTLEEAYSHIGQPPGTGSPRYAHELNLPGLRCWPLTRYPHLVFYVECTNHIDVWRVLHGKRDIPAWMHEPENIRGAETCLAESLIKEYVMTEQGGVTAPLRQPHPTGHQAQLEAITPLSAA